MLTPARFQLLLQLPAPLLTAYVSTKPTGRYQHRLTPEYLIWLDKEAKAIALTLPPSEKELFQEQLERTKNYLHTWKPEEKGLVVFSGAGAWRLVPLRVEVENEVRWGRPALTQYLRLLSENKPCGIVVVDRTGARFLRYRLGELSESAKKQFRVDISQWKKPEVGHFSRAGGTTGGTRRTRGTQRDVFAHRMDARYGRLFSATAKQAMDLCAREGLAALFLVGSERLLEPIKESFPQEFRSRVVSIPEDLSGLSGSELQQRLEPRLTAWSLQQGSALVTSLLADEAATVVGFDQTLAHLQKGKIRALVLTRDLDAILHHCVVCNWMDRSGDPRCPVCGGKRTAVTLRDVLPGLAHSHKVGVEVVSGAAAERLQAEGGMGAWLRQPKQTRLRQPARRAS
ncbi:MAG: hypothetical protein LAN61_15420 [Acidobacteriia bacterium]|nr:hypothetical protein [Terriglobia bacterium]